MFNGKFAERVALFRAKGGKRTTAFWLLRRLVQLDVYRFYAMDLARTDLESDQPLPEGHAILVLRSFADVETCDPLVVAEIDKQSGCGVAEAVRRDGRIYAIVRGTRVVSQLRIEFRKSRIDTPLDMVLEFGDKDAFLSFLYTDPSSRHEGWAAKLISIVCMRLASEGWRHCICHVQATNLRSVNTFSRSGWVPFAWLFATAKGRLLSVIRQPSARRMGIMLHAKPV